MLRWLITILPDENLGFGPRKLASVLVANSLSQSDILHYCDCVEGEAAFPIVDHCPALVHRFTVKLLAGADLVSGTPGAGPIHILSPSPNVRLRLNNSL